MQSQVLISFATYVKTKARRWRNCGVANNSPISSHESLAGGGCCQGKSICIEVTPPEVICFISTRIKLQTPEMSLMSLPTTKPSMRVVRFGFVNTDGMSDKIRDG